VSTPSRRPVKAGRQLRSTPSEVPGLLVMGSTEFGLLGTWPLTTGRHSGGAARDHQVCHSGVAHAPSLPRGRSDAGKGRHLSLLPVPVVEIPHGSQGPLPRRDGLCPDHHVTTPPRPQDIATSAPNINIRPPCPTRLINSAGGNDWIPQ